MKQPKQQQKLGALIRDLERELSDGKSQAAALEETQGRLRETARICQELADENRRLEKEIATWRERFAGNEENQRQLMLLGQRLDALQAEHARVTERNHLLEEKLAERNQRVGRASVVEDVAIVQSRPSAVAGCAPELTASGEADVPLLNVENHGATKLGKHQIAWTWLMRNWQWGAAVAGVIMLAILGAITVRNFKGDVRFANDLSNPEATTADAVAEPVSQPAATKVATVRGAFQTVRPTQVFSAPSQDSELILNIAKGTKVNVVDSRDGWLEIRSKHGRPPGFIRQETAVRLN